MRYRTNLKGVETHGQQPNSVPNDLDCYLKPYIVKEGEDTVSELMIADLITSIEPLLHFAVWFGLLVQPQTQDVPVLMVGCELRCMAIESAWCFHKRDTAMTTCSLRQEMDKVGWIS